MQTKKIIPLVATLLCLAISNVYAEGYKATSHERALRISNIESLERGAEKNMGDKGAFDYIAGGSDNENILRDNVSAFDNKKIIPRVLQNISSKDVDIRTTFMGINLKTPIIFAPVAAHAFLHTEGEVATAKGTAKAGALYTISTVSTKPLDQVVAAAPDTPWMFQIYMSSDEKINKFYLDEAKKYGSKAIILTVDIVGPGNRERDIKNNFKLGSYPMDLVNRATASVGKTAPYFWQTMKKNFSPEDIKWIKEYSGLPVIVKGIQHPDDAELAIQAGADAIWVSNHGGRQVGGAVAAFDLLPDVAKAVNKRVPIVFDSGIRAGSHIFKALASGADIVSIGRPLLYGLNLGGAEGLNSVYQKFNDELINTMAGAGAKTIEDAKKTLLADAK